VHLELGTGFCFEARQKRITVDDGGEAAKGPLSRLHQFLASGKLQVRVLPDQHFDLIHGKAGVIMLTDGSKTAFLGSLNESIAVWAPEYELPWKEASAGAIGLPRYLREAYTVAENFCQTRGARMRGSGFLKTLLLRRAGIGCGECTPPRHNSRACEPSPNRRGPGGSRKRLRRVTA